MKLNIEYVNDPKEPKVTPVDQLKTGTVYKISYGNILLKVADTNPLILTTSKNGNIWLGTSTKGKGNFANEPAVEILGKLVGVQIER